MKEELTQPKFYKEVNKRVNPIKLTLIRNLHKPIEVSYSDKNTISGILLGFNDFLNVLVRVGNKIKVFRNYESLSFNNNGFKNVQTKPIQTKPVQTKPIQIEPKTEKPKIKMPVVVKKDGVGKNGNN